MTALPRDRIVAVIGAGTMGAGIAQVAAAAGHPVLLYDLVAGAAETGIAGVKANLDRLVERKKIAADQSRALLGRIAVARRLEELAPAALIVEAVIEKLEVKRQLFETLEKLVSKETILATNTSSLSITAIAAGMSRPDRIAGMHFFNPAPVMELVEVVTGIATAPSVAEVVLDTAKAWGKSPVMARSTPGFIANRIARPFYGEALRLLEESAADVATIDTAMRACGGFSMGTFEIIDLIGIDVNFLVTQSVWQAFFNDPRYAPSLMQQEMVAAGRHGRKTRRGWYDYHDGAAKPEPRLAPAGLKPKTIVLSQNPELAQARGAFDSAAPLVALARHAGIAVKFDEAPPDFDLPGGIQYASAGGGDLGAHTAEAQYEPLAETAIRLDGAVLRLSRGETSHEPGWREPGDVPIVHYDLAFDFAACTHIAISLAPDAPRTALLAAAGFFQAIGKTVLLVEDVPGLICLRIVAMLANEAADAVYRGVCSAADADLATLKGLNYPLGPLAWGRKLGWHRINDVMRGLAGYYGDPRYRVSPLIRRWDAEGERRP